MSTIRHTILCIYMLLMLLPAQAQLSPNDKNSPFGWATCTSMTSGDDYDLTGGGDGTSITLTAGSNDMRKAIIDAIERYDVIVLDGAQGDFVISETIDIKELSNKTIVGINNARLCTQFYVTPEITTALDKAGVKDMSSTGGGGTLSNGQSVGEEREYYTRKTLIELLNDPKESYRSAGIFYISECENFIMRNIQFVGPGPIDVGGDDLVSIINGSKHIWIDHCDFTDGIDGNLDITVKSDFITVSWCTFSYTARAYDHMNSNLIGGSDSASAQGANNLNVTWACNIWGNGCNQRMPMARFGTIHIINNYYNCPGNSAGINARKDSEMLIENNYFEVGVKKIFSENDAKAYNFSGNVFNESFTASNSGNVTIPYRYALYAALDVPETLTDKNTGAGATLNSPLSIGESTSDDESDATLVSFTIAGVTTYTQEDTYNYSVTLPATTTAIEVTTVTAHSRAKVEITAPASVTELPAVATIKVTAPDNTTTCTYTINISRELSDDTSLASLTVNGGKAVRMTAEVYAYRLPTTATTIEVEATPRYAAARVSDMIVPDIDELPADATFTVIAEDGTKAYYTLELTQSESQFADGKKWDFGTWSTASRNLLAENSDVWSDMGDGRYEHTFSEATELGMDETEAIAFVNDVRINPSTSGAGYIQGSLSMYIPVMDGQKLTFTFSHTSNSKGSRQLLVNDEEIGSTSSTSKTTATYTVPAGTTTLVVRGSEGLRYYSIDMTAAPITPDTPDTPDTPEGVANSWVFDQWNAQGVIPANFTSTFTHDGLTVIYGSKAKFGNAEKNFYDGHSYTTFFDTGGGGSTTSQALSLNANADDEIVIYCNAGEKGREVVIFDGFSEVCRTSSDVVEHTFAMPGSYYIYSGGSAIRFYALQLKRPTYSKPTLDTLDALRYINNAITSTNDECIYIYNMQGVCIAMGKHTIEVGHLQDGLYIARCGNHTLRFAKCY